MKRRDFIFPAIIALLCAVVFFTARRPRSAAGRVVTRIDTLVVRDTVRDTVRVPKIVYAVRTDTVWMREAAGDDSIRVALPIERKVYETENYRAVVEGFRPVLTGMEVYRNTVHIDRQTTLTPPPRRWGIGVHAGYGIGTKGPAPYIGVGVQYNVIMW